MGCVISGTQYRWPNGIVPYEIDEDDYPTDEIFYQNIIAAINHWNTNTPIQLVPKTREDEDYVRFEKGKPCSGEVGYKRKGKQFIKCQKPSYGAMVHEIGLSGNCRDLGRSGGSSE